MNIRALIRNVVAKVCMASVCLLAMSSCDNWLYEEEGDCSVYYRLKFRYDMNLKWADAFANEVTSIHLYAFDKSGVLAWQKAEQIVPGTAENYSMLLDLPAGDYKLLAWCGLQNDGEQDESFSVPEARVGETRMEQLQCALNRQHDESGAYSNEHLYRLFHGVLDVSLPVNDDGGSYEYIMSLIKNTNHIRVILQHLSGVDVNKDDFIFRIDDENGLMAYDNELSLGCTECRGRHWHGWQPCRQQCERSCRRLHSRPPDRDTPQEDDTCHRHQGRQEGGTYSRDGLRLDGKGVL